MKHGPVARTPAVIRRKFVQAMLLVLLAGAAAWFYVAREGGVDAVMTALLGRDPPAQAPDPAAAPSPRAAASAAPPASASAGGARRAPAGARTVPSHPVQGEIRDATFRLDAARIESGVLRLRQREPALTIELVLPVNPWQVPAERSFEVLAPQRRAADTPLVRVTAPGADSRAGRREYAERYTLWLEFGRERTGTLPGRLHLVLPDAAGSRVAGTFVADIRGFRFVGGRPDLTVDSLDTLEYLALREILRNDPEQALTDLAFAAGRLVEARGNAPASGYLEVRYRTGGATVQRAFRFVKENGRWRIAGRGRSAQTSR